MSSELFLSDVVKNTLRDVPDFPKPGIVFKDLTPLLQSPDLCKMITETLLDSIRLIQPDAIVCLDSRGFWFGLPLAMGLNIPMVPVRKKGKLPFEVLTQSYALEYGEAVLEMHTDALRPGMRVVIHDDVLATGGTAEAAAALVKKAQAQVVGFTFLVELSALKGREVLSKFEAPIGAVCSIK
ncbi:MAG: adenine phosphoribosyltransferase [Cytophagaceae bacterium]|jgi:adenine phosphoribosyltransferase|nr:adenine phosphoribosyltransferase [Cytophagaceae bacterium]